METKSSLMSAYVTLVNMRGEKPLSESELIALGHRARYKRVWEDRFITANGELVDVALLWYGIELALKTHVHPKETTRVPDTEVTETRSLPPANQLASKRERRRDSTFESAKLLESLFDVKIGDEC